MEICLVVVKNSLVIEFNHFLIINFIVSSIAILSIRMQLNSKRVMLFTSLVFGGYAGMLGVPDYISYKEIYEVHTPSFSEFIFYNKELHDRSEFLYNLISSISTSLGVTFNYFRFALIALSFWLKVFLFYCVLPKRIVPIAISAYIAFFAYNDVMWLRQSLASGIIALSLLYFDKNNKKFISMAFVASFIHASSVSVFLLYLRKFISNGISILLLITLIVYVFVTGEGVGTKLLSLVLQYNVPYITSAISTYSNILDDPDLNLGLIRGSVVLSTLVILITFIIRNQLKMPFARFQLIYVCGFIGLIFLVLFSDIGNLLSDRMYKLFGFSYPILIAIIFERFKNQIKFIPGNLLVFFFVAATSLFVPIDRTFIIINE